MQNRYWSNARNLIGVTVTWGLAWPDRLAPPTSKTIVASKSAGWPSRIVPLRVAPSQASVAPSQASDMPSVSTRSCVRCSNQRSSMIILAIITVLCTHTAARRSVPRSMPRGGIRASTCPSDQGISATAVSIVYAMCPDDVVLAAQAVATASVSGCADAVAAGVGVAFAALTPGDLQVVESAAFSAVLGNAQSVDDAAALAAALALAVASNTPSFLTQTDMLSALADAINYVALNSGCNIAIPAALAVVNTLSDLAPALAPPFVQALGWGGGGELVTGNAPGAICTLPTAPPPGTSTGTSIKRRFEDRGVAGGRLGRVQRNVFSRDILRKRNTATLSVTIAQAACPTYGDAALAATAVAIAYRQDRQMASAAISGVIAAGVPLTQMATFIFKTRNADGVRVLADAIAVTSGADLDRLLREIAAALRAVYTGLGCDTATLALDMLETVVSPDVTAQLVPMVCALVGPVQYDPSNATRDSTCAGMCR